jgi:hypothetical protein
MSEDDIEEMVRELIECHLNEEGRLGGREGVVLSLVSPA